MTGELNKELNKQSNKQSKAEMQDSLTIIQFKSTNKKPVFNDNTVLIKPETVNSFSPASSKTILSIKKVSSTPQSTKQTHKTTLVKIGSTIKNRFILVEVLGIGGMGKVYKAIDLRKQEAHDKNPFVAIKVLNDEFREHPESLIALQREARKSQLLAHPNIVNVYDFDRDGSIVYMTMELLQGKSLDRVIADDYPNGMHIEQAEPIINSVANAVLYAHQHGIIHSDLKPGNVYITSNNVAKIFDFGIARACKPLAYKNERHENKHAPDTNNSQPDIFNPSIIDPTIFDPTIFDPTTLGALTPAYASLEMLEGHAPEQHDDLYSIACVFYELLSGQHPYNRLPADEAKKKNLHPKKISSLSKFKSNALFKSLELSGNERFENIELFIKAFNQKKQSTFRVMLALLSILILASIIFYPQLDEHYKKYQQDSFILSVHQTNFEKNPKATDLITKHINGLDGQSKIYVMKQVKEKWLAAVKDKLNKSIDSQENLYDNSHQLLLISQQYYPDSARVARMFELIEQQKFVRLNQLNNQFNELLEIAQLSQFSDSNEQQEIINIINTIKKIDPIHPLINDQRLLIIFQESIEKLLTKYQLEQAEELLKTAQIVFTDNIVLLNLSDKLKSKASEKIQQNIVSHNSSNINISILKNEMSVLITKVELDDEWDNRMTQIYSQLSQNLGRKSYWLIKKKQTLASLYLQQSVKMREKQRLIESRRFMDKAKQYNAGIYGLKDEEDILSAFENIVRVKYKAKQQQAEIDGLKSSLKTQMKAQKMHSALRSYQELKRILGRNDPYVSGEARQALAEAYYKQAKQLLRSKDYEDALAVVDKGFKFARLHSGLRSLKKKARKRLELKNKSKLLAEMAHNNSLKKTAKNKYLKKSDALAKQKVIINAFWD